MEDLLTAQRIRIAARDDEAQKSREKVCQLAAEAFDKLGDLLQVSGHMFGDQRVTGESAVGNGDDGVVALGYVSKTGASLCSGAAVLLDQRNTYAASALVRQLVEVEYLAWALAEDRDEANAWLRSTREERLQRWQPRHLRERSNGRFRGKDYADHCEAGGHPTPTGSRSFLSYPNSMHGVTWYELTLHAESVWRYLVDGVRTMDVVPTEAFDELDSPLREAIESWLATDALCRLTGTRGRVR